MKKKNGDNNNNGGVCVCVCARRHGRKVRGLYIMIFFRKTKNETTRISVENVKTKNSKIISTNKRNNNLLRVKLRFLFFFFYSYFQLHPIN